MKDREWKTHKYYTKIKDGLKSYRYFYSKEEYDAFKNGLKTNLSSFKVNSKSNDDKKNYTVSSKNENTSDKKSVSRNDGLAIAQLGNRIINQALDNTNYVPLHEDAENATKESWKDKGYKSYRDYKKAIIEGKEPIPKKEKETSVKEDLRAINKKENYTSRDISFQNNCIYCTLAFDMRRRGYDVVGEDQYSVDNEFTATDWYEGDRKFTTKTNNGEKTKKAIEAELESKPDGSYGQFCCTWINNGGHSMVWYKENDQVYIYDTQSINFTTQFSDEYYEKAAEQIKKYESEVAEMDKSYDSAVAAMEKDFDNRSSQMDKDFDDSIAEMEAEEDEDIQRMYDDYNEALSKAKSLPSNTDYEKRVKKMEMEHAIELKEMADNYKKSVEEDRVEFHKSIDEQRSKAQKELDEQRESARNSIENQREEAKKELEKQKDDLESAMNGGIELSTWMKTYGPVVKEYEYMRTDDLRLSKKALKKVDYN